jgi:hypothetical protein
MWESLKEIIERISERPGPLLMVCGVLLFTFGIAEGIKYESWLPLTDPIGRYSAIAGGIVVFLVGVYFAKRSPAPLLKAEAYGIKIRTPNAKSISRLRTSPEISRSSLRKDTH